MDVIMLIALNKTVQRLKPLIKEADVLKKYEVHTIFPANNIKELIIKFQFKN